MGYRLNRLDEPVVMAVSKSLLTEFDIHYRVESCGVISTFLRALERCAFISNDCLHQETTE